ncbi:dihydrofolate reductase-like domain-containing protein [Gaertneriomyces semiglobifer]|nr:dihydrofolate reductase-like domain-containing protein [Gaertneriomyces semiglobifer]
MPGQLNLIVASLANGGIGVNGRLPWSLPGDMRFFQLVTTYMGRRPGSSYPSGHSASASPTTAPQNVVIMGRKTWLSIPAKFRPLKERINIVLSRDSAFRADVNETQVYAFPTLDDALLSLENIAHLNVFVIGGAQLYGTALKHPACSRVFQTCIKSDAPIACDVYFPELPPSYKRLDAAEVSALVGPDCPEGPQLEKGFEYQFYVYERNKYVQENKQST